MAQLFVRAQYNTHGDIGDLRVNTLNTEKQREERELGWEGEKEEEGSKLGRKEEESEGKGRGQERVKGREKESGKERGREGAYSPEILTKTFLISHSVLFYCCVCHHQIG